VNEIEFDTMTAKLAQAFVQASLEFVPANPAPRWMGGRA
jgi:hypothetical protein